MRLDPFDYILSQIEGQPKPEEFIPAQIEGAPKPNLNADESILNQIEGQPKPEEFIPAQIEGIPKPKPTEQPKLSASKLNAKAPQFVLAQDRSNISVPKHVLQVTYISAPVSAPVIYSSAPVNAQAPYLLAPVNAQVPSVQQAVSPSPNPNFLSSATIYRQVKLLPKSGGGDNTTAAFPEPFTPKFNGTGNSANQNQTPVAQQNSPQASSELNQRKMCNMRIPKF